MKRFKRLAVLVLAAVMMLTVSVSAYAGYFDNAYVDGLYNTEGQYFIRIGKFNILTLDSVARNLAQQKGADAYTIKTKIRFADDKMLINAFGSDGMVVSLMTNWHESDWDFSTVLGGRLYSNDDQMKDAGFVAFIGGDSEFLSTVANTE